LNDTRFLLLDAAGEFRDIDAMCESRAAIGGVEDDLGGRRCDVEPLRLLLQNDLLLAGAQIAHQ
ncbi:hypothetical protein, partial [Rhizobium johnstonii]|uniref:hypothetical protein n=1 Tax=Rhizobium johnstonii TaxID=3019933 RepID=UPI003F986E83